MKLLVCGSCSYTNYREFEGLLSAYLHEKRPTEIISGGAGGADSLASIYCHRHGIPNTVVKPDWKTLGRGAGFARNLEMLSMVDSVVAFWDGQSKGTKHTIDSAQRLGLFVIVYNVGG